MNRRTFRSKADGMNRRTLVWHCLACLERYTDAKPKACACGEKKFAFFPSKAEANRFAALNLQQRAGLIAGLTLQPSFPITSRRDPAKTLFTYRADFSYVRDGETIIEDVKGLATDVFLMKKALVEDEHGITINVVKAR